MNTLQIKQLSPNATLPTRTHTTDAGLDIYASEDIIVTHTHAVIIPTGIAVSSVSVSAIAPSDKNSFFMYK